MGLNDIKLWISEKTVLCRASLGAKAKIWVSKEAAPLLKPLSETSAPTELYQSHCPRYHHVGPRGHLLGSAWVCPAQRPHRCTVSGRGLLGTMRRAGEECGRAPVICLLFRSRVFVPSRRKGNPGIWGKLSEASDDVGLLIRPFQCL